MPGIDEAQAEEARQLAARQIEAAAARCFLRTPSLLFLRTVALGSRPETQNFLEIFESGRNAD